MWLSWGETSAQVEQKPRVEKSAQVQLPVGQLKCGWERTSGGEEESGDGVGLEYGAEGPGCGVHLGTKRVDDIGSGYPRGLGDIDVFMAGEMDGLLRERTGGDTNDDGECSENSDAPVSI